MQKRIPPYKWMVELNFAIFSRKKIGTGLLTETGNADIISKRASGKILSGVVKVSTGVLKLEKRAAG